MSPTRMYDDNLYRFDTAQKSYWEATADELPLEAAPLSGEVSCDVAIIGGGFTGLSAARRLAERYQLDVRVLEAGHIGWGASGRNGGFCCVGGSALRPSDFVRREGQDAAREYYQRSAEAVDFVQALLGDEDIDAEAIGDGEIEVAHTARAWAQMQKEHAVLSDALGMRAELLPAEECRQEVYRSSENFGGMRLQPGFGLHPLRYCRGLARAAASRGARLHSHSHVKVWETKPDGRHRLITDAGAVTADKVLYACNGFIQEQLQPAFYGRTLPIISSIVVTRPLTDDELAAENWLTQEVAINSRLIMNYFRLLPDRRFLFGGRGDTRGDAAGEQATHEANIAMLRRLFPGWRNVDIDYRWHGLICYLASLRPSTGYLTDDPSVFFSHGYHGNGVSMASWSGYQVAEWIGSGSQPKALPQLMTGGLTPRFPMPRLRSLIFRMGVAVGRWIDNRS